VQQRRLSGESDALSDDDEFESRWKEGIDSMIDDARRCFLSEEIACGSLICVGRSGALIAAREPLLELTELCALLRGCVPAGIPVS
jgi:hypothetical protein